MPFKGPRKAAFIETGEARVKALTEEVERLKAERDGALDAYVDMELLRRKHKARAEAAEERVKVLEAENKALREN